MASRRTLVPPGACLPDKAHHWLLDQFPVYGLYHAVCRHCLQETDFPVFADKEERESHTWVDYAKNRHKKGTEA